MTTLILHPTDMCQWHALVNEAQASSQIVLDVETESYLVFLLMRFTQGVKLMESVLALDFLESMQVIRRRQIDLLRDVGDKSLLFCGLFPGMAQKRGVSLGYYSDLGQSAYLTVSELEMPSASLYAGLSSEFMNLSNILQAMRGRF